MDTSKFAIVTGGTSGIGKSVVEQLLARGGIKVAALSRHPDPQAPKSENYSHVACDISRPESIREAVAQAQRFGGDGIDYLFNISGICPHESFLEATEETLDYVYSVNMKGTFLMAQTVANIMVKHGHGGSIVNTSSVAGALSCLLLSPAYHMTKAAIINLTKVMANELGQYNIRTNCVAPWIIYTPMTDTQLDTPEKVNFFNSVTPLGRVGTPEEIAACMVFLGLDAHYVSGQTLFTDGGVMTKSV
jgi:2-deoxy-D-gluconate 3-dehydrogenase